MTLLELQSDIKAVNEVLTAIANFLPASKTNAVIKFLEVADTNILVQNVVLLVIEGLTAQVTVNP